ncbi:MAG: UbiD family decarboxylase [Thermodesulfobacteriota bacterium]
MKDLRQWIENLEKEAPGELVRVSKSVDPDRFEASAIMHQLESRELYPAVLFENPKVMMGENPGFRILMNTFGNLKKISVAMGLSPESPRTRLMEAMLQRQGGELDVTIVDTASAPVRENVLSGDEVDLNILPLVRHVEMDGERYLTPIVVSKNLTTGRYNISWNRQMYLDSKHLAIYMSPRHLWTYFAEAENAKKNLPVALVLGHHPAFHMTGALLCPLDTDEYKVAGHVLGESIRVTPSTYYGEDLYIPADAEIVVEGEVVANHRTVEGPFGEYLGYSGSQRVSWLFEAKAINFRSKGIIIDIFPCMTEHRNAHLPIEASIFRTVKQAAPSVIQTNWIHSGGPLTIVIQMKKQVEGEPMRAAMSAFTTSNFIKIVIVVDEDIDPTDLKEVMWAVSTRVQPNRDIQILNGLQGQMLDPSITEEEIIGSGMIIDATKPLGRPFPRRGRVPAEVLQKVRLEDYLSTRPG